VDLTTVSIVEASSSTVTTSTVTIAIFLSVMRSATESASVVP
jgi:hypothetical protein